MGKKSSENDQLMGEGFHLNNVVLCLTNINLNALLTYFYGF